LTVNVAAFAKTGTGRKNAIIAATMNAVTIEFDLREVLFMSGMQ
jgi:hypothetical protein